MDNIPPEAIRVGGEVSIEALHSLLNKIWRQEEIPDEWRKGLLVKLPKKGDTTYCKNLRGITLLATASKVLSKIILDRMKAALDSLLRDEQLVFARSVPVQIKLLLLESSLNSH